MDQDFTAFEAGSLVGNVIALLLVAALVIWVVRSVRRRSGTGTAYGTPPVAMPPGWYADPVQPGMQRWWDGGRWTEHVHGGAAGGAVVAGPGALSPPAGPFSPIG